MSAVTHGIPGRPFAGRPFAGRRRPGWQARTQRGADWERAVALGLEGWLAAEPGEFHLFHDLYGIPGFAPNIDHVVLTGTGCLVLDAKWLQPGYLFARAVTGRGWLRRADGNGYDVEWLTAAWHGSAAATLAELPGGRCFVVPDHTVVTASVAAARCLTGDHGGLTAAVLPLADIPRVAHGGGPRDMAVAVQQPGHRQP